MPDNGSIRAIYISAAGEGRMVSTGAVRAIQGQGLEGDRYATRSGTFSAHTGSGREVTLIEAEALEALEREYDITLGPEESRRNLVTQGVALNHLVGREFTVGDATLRGVRLCEPCGHLEGMTRKGVRKGLAHRGGLRADIVVGGVIRVGDAIDAKGS